MKGGWKFLFPARWVVAFDAVALLSWVYVLTNVLIGDVTQFALSQVDPGLAWIASFRLVIFLVVAAIVIVFLGPPRFVFFVSYLILFPFIFLVWKVPAVLVWIGSWLLGIAFANFCISLVSDLRYSITSSAIYVLSVTMMVLAGDRWVTIAATLLLSLAVIASYGKALRDAFRGPRILGAYKGLFTFVSSMYSSEDKAVLPKGRQLAEIPKHELSNYTTRLQNQVMANRACLFFAEKLRNYQGSEANLVTGILRILFLVAITCVSLPSYTQAPPNLIH